MADQVVVNFIDNPHAPEVHCTAYSGIWTNAGKMHLTLEAARVDHRQSPGPINRVVVGRVVMPIPQAIQMAENILKFLKNPGSPAPTPDTTALH